MDKQPPPLPMSPEGGLKSALNLAMAIPLVLLAFWILLADLRYPGNLIFQDSISALIAGMFLGFASLLLLVFAVIPKRIIVAANFLLAMRAGLGWPLSLLIDHTLACRLVSFLLLVLSIYYFASILRQPGLKLHLRPWVQWKHSLKTALSLVAVGIISLPMVLVGYFEAGKTIMGSYVRFSWTGISLVERVLVKEGHQVHLIGMMHMGDGTFYKELNERMYARPETGRRLVLTEGVADSQDLLPADFKSGELYANLAAALGLEPQNEPINLEQLKLERRRDFDVPGVSFRNADIDISELEKKHVEDLVVLLTLLGSFGTPELLLAEPEGMSGRDMEILFFDVLLRQRNNVLMEHFDASASRYAEVFIPWGAAHLPDIESRLLEQGYVEQQEVVRPIVKFWD